MTLIYKLHSFTRSCKILKKIIKFFLVVENEKVENEEKVLVSSCHKGNVLKNFKSPELRFS